MCCWVIQQLLSTSGSFFALEPAVQAYVQATAKRLVCFPGISLHMPAVLVLVATVPLLHAKDYEHVLDMPSAGMSACTSLALAYVDSQAQASYSCCVVFDVICHASTTNPQVGV